MAEHRLLCRCTAAEETLPAIYYYNGSEHEHGTRGRLFT